MVEYEGTHDVGETWNLWINGELSAEYVESVTVKKGKWGDDYQVIHNLQGPRKHKITVTEEDLEEVLKDKILDNKLR